MNVIKQHLFEVVCGLVIVAAMSTYFLWSSWDANTQEAAGQRNGEQQHVRTILTTNTPMPGLDPNDPKNVIKGPLPGDSGDLHDKGRGSAVKKRQEIYNDLEQSAKLISNSETQLNSHNRMINGFPTLPVFDSKGVMTWEPQPYLLPVTITTGAHKQDPHEFQQTYNGAYNGFLNFLGAGMPPTKEEVDAAFDKWQAGLAPKAHPAAGFGGATTRDPVQYREFAKHFVMEWDAKIRIYADRSSFQIEPWVLYGTAPDESQIFHACVYTWIQADLVNAINKVNGTIKNAQGAPIKRIEMVTIGATSEAGSVLGTPAFVAPAATGMGGGGATAALPTGAATGSGPLFISMTTGGQPVAAEPNPNSTTPAAAAVNGYTKSMTGRAVSTLFDVTHVRVVLHMDPGAINQLLSELYKQSNSYTLINVNMQAIDPLDAAANGFIYGSTPMMRVELVLEAVFYRSWLEQMMPDQGVRLAIGLKPMETGGGRNPGGGGPGGGPGGPGGAPGGAVRQPPPAAPLSNGRQAPPPGTPTPPN